MFHFRTHKSPLSCAFGTTTAHPPPPPNSGQMLFSLVQKWSSHNTLIAPSSSTSFFCGGGGRVSICKCSCFHELYLASWKYITERPFFLTVFFQDCSRTLYYNIFIYCAYLVQLWRLKELVSNSVQVFGFSEVGLDQPYLLGFLSQEKILYGICEILKIDQIAMKMFMVIFHNNKVCN